MLWWLIGIIAVVLLAAALMDRRRKGGRLRRGAVESHGDVKEGHPTIEDRFRGIPGL